MSTSMPTTLYALLAPEFAPLFGEVDADSPAVDAIQNLRQQLEENVQTLDWSSVQNEINRQLSNLLNISLSHILVNAWTTHPQVQKAIQQQRDSGTHDVAVVPLLPHKIRSDHQPSLRILVNQKHATNIPLDIRIVLKLHEVILKIQYGEIQAIITGEAEGMGMIYYQKNKLKENIIERFELPKSLAPKINQDNETTNAKKQRKRKRKPHRREPWLDEQSDLPDENRPSEQQFEARSSHRSRSFFRNFFYLLAGIGLAIVLLALFVHFG